MRRMAIMAAVLAAAVCALSAWPAQAQMAGGHHRPSGDDAKSEPKKPQVDDKAYKAALDRIPEPKDKYDPWGGARPATPDTKKIK